jgi:hypothetical protein
MDTLETLQLYLPIQYEFGLPKFCTANANTVISESTKYTYAGVHMFRKPGITDIIYNSI